MAFVERSDANGLATLTLNRPDKLNALSSRVIAELDAHLMDIAMDVEGVGAVLLRGAGRCFSSGLDLAEKPDEQINTAHDRAGVIHRLAALPQPVVAAVHGACYTGALELALAADIIVAADTARFADTHGTFGLVPGWGMTQRLPRRVGRSQASRLSFTATPIGADEALCIGLIDVVEPEAQFAEGVAGLCSAIINNSSHSNLAIKRLMLETDGMALDAGLAYEFFQRPPRAVDSEDRIARFFSR